MKNLQAICATLTLLMAFGAATAYAEDGIMGTGTPTPRSIVDSTSELPSSTDADALNLLVETELRVWQNIIALF
jgi:hypothetical protein